MQFSESGVEDPVDIEFTDETGIDEGENDYQHVEKGEYRDIGTPEPPAHIDFNYAPVDGNLKNEIGRQKAQVTLLPPVTSIVGSLAMEDGASKYGPYNWREGRVEYMQYLNAMLRHIYALIDGEDFAEDSQVHHLGHVIATAGIILDAQGVGVLEDDRPGPGPSPDALKEAQLRRG